MTIIMIVAGFLFVSVSAYLAGLVGSSNNPVSGITIATILFASVVLVLLLGRDSPIGAVAAIMIGAVVCCAAAVGGDNLQDLKAGYHRRCDAVEAAADAGHRCVFLRADHGAGAEPAGRRPTASARRRRSIPTRCRHRRPRLMASVAKGMFGGKLPWDMIAIGAGVGAVDHRLRRMAEVAAVELPGAGARRRHRHLPAAGTDGADLPRRPAGAPGRSASGIVSDDDEAAKDRMHRPGTLFSAGLITGEALMGIAIAVPIVMTERADVLALPPAWHFGQWVGSGGAWRRRLAAVPQRQRCRRRRLTNRLRLMARLCAASRLIELAAQSLLRPAACRRPGAGRRPRRQARGFEVRDTGRPRARVRRPALSPDGRVVVFAGAANRLRGQPRPAPRCGSSDLLTRDAAPPVRFTPEGWNVNCPAFSPDGTTVYFLVGEVRLDAAVVACRSPVATP